MASHTRSNDAYAYTGHANANVSNNVNGLNQVTATGGVSVTHDSNGNVSAIGSDSYTYTPENQLASGPNSGVYVYDALGRMYYAGGVSTVYLQPDGARTAAAIAPGGAVQESYVYGAGLDEPLVAYQGSGTSTRRWLHADERGSVIAVSDGSGNLVGSNPNRYDEYGVPQGTLTGRFGYAGRPWLAEVGMYDDRARAYNPAMGRFMQADPIGARGGMNVYAYVGNNPVNFTDPFGLERICVTPPGERGAEPRCVWVDGDGDGDSHDNDMNESEADTYRNDFAGFIVSYGGSETSPLDLLPYGVPSFGDNTAYANQIGVVSQFIGAAIAFSGNADLQRAWDRVLFILVWSYGRGQQIAAATTAWMGSPLTGLAEIRISGSGGINSPYMSLYGMPSEMAKLLLHEVFHGLYPAGLSTSDHLALDGRAATFLVNSGLGGGGCVARGHWPACPH
jgi:RHS repeat-associated protein